MLKIDHCILRQLPFDRALAEALTHLLLHLALVEPSTLTCHPRNQPLHPQGLVRPGIRGSGRGWWAASAGWRILRCPVLLRQSLRGSHHCRHQAGGGAHAVIKPCCDMQLCSSMQLQVQLGARLNPKS